MPMNFTDVLDTKIEDVERPPNIPVGTYRAVVSKVPSYDTIGSETKWDVVDFQLRLLEAVDVSQEDLDAYGGLTEDSVIRHRFMFDKEDDSRFKRSLFNLRRFLQDHLKIDMNDNTPIKEALANAVNQHVMVFVRWRPDKNDPEIQWSEVGKTAPV